MRLVAALAVAGAALAASPAHAGDVVRVGNPVDGCVYRVWTPTFTVHSGPSGEPGLYADGGAGQSVDCP